MRNNDKSAFHLPRQQTNLISAILDIRALYKWRSQIYNFFTTFGVLDKVELQQKDCSIRAVLEKGRHI